ncbi:MAG: tRNA glutamyl-Q(34) synthetase GluQRS [Phycisphaerales bacterium JB039]
MGRTPAGEVTRLAPSPTGALHLGNCRTFLANWLLARQRGWRIVLRIEDLDGPRIKPWATAAAIDALAWLGLDWDDGPLTQSEDLAPYIEAMRRLGAAGLAYPCDLTRSEIEAAASAPQEGTGEIRFPPELRPAPGMAVFDALDCNWRFRTPDEAVVIDDGFAGRVALHPLATIGDFVIWTRRGAPAYQLAVVVDDARQGVTQVVRGDDLLDSAGRQRLLLRALELTEPAWTHLPLVVGPDGRRLAKRHGDTRLDRYREAGVGVERVLGLLGWWLGAIERRRACRLDELLERFDLDRVSPDPVRFSSEDDAWLLGGSSSAL